MLRSIMWVLFAALCLNISTANAAATQKAASICDIQGTVSQLRFVQSATLVNGAPSAMSTTERHIYVTLSSRTPHDKNAKSDDICHANANGETRTYKICSPIRVKKGDIIKGTEGTQTGSAKATGCIFDLVVIPQKS